jgi:hypothetical protein
MAVAVTFTPRIKWKERVNQLDFMYEWYGIHLPAGLTDDYAKAPKFVSMAEMITLSQSGGAARNTPGGLSITEGMVSPDLKINFADPERQWRVLPGPDGKPPVRGPANFQFQGGEVFLDLTLGFYILDSVKPGDDDKSRKIFNIHYEHELLHVLDETDIVKNWLPGRARAEPTAARYFVQAEPFNYGVQSQTTAEARTAFLDYIGQPLFNLWATEANRRTRLRDSPAEYKKLSDQIEKITYGNSTR